MDFFSVWWYDLLLVLSIAPQIVRLFLGGKHDGLFSVVSVAFQLVSIVALAFIGCELTDVLVVLMLFAAVCSGLSFLETRLDRSKDEPQEKEESLS